MSRFRNLAHVLYYTKYHLVWTPKYRYRVLGGEVGKEVASCIHSFMSWLGCEVIELNVQSDHVHMVAWILPKHSVSYVMGVLKGRTSIRVFKKFPWMKQKPYWGNHFCAEGYCVDTVGLDEEKIRLYVKWQEDKERRAEALAKGDSRQGLLNLKG